MLGEWEETTGQMRGTSQRWNDLSGGESCFSHPLCPNRIGKSQCASAPLRPCPDSQVYSPCLPADFVWAVPGCRVPHYVPPLALKIRTTGKKRDREREKKREVKWWSRFPVESLGRRWPERWEAVISPSREVHRQCSRERVREESNPQPPLKAVGDLRRLLGRPQGAQEPQLHWPPENCQSVIVTLRNRSPKLGSGIGNAFLGFVYE